MAGPENGTGAPPHPRSNGAPAQPPNELEALCRELKSKVETFLDAPTDDDVLHSVKKQIKIAREVIEEALRRYRYVVYIYSFLILYFWFHCPTSVCSGKADYGIRTIR